MTYPPSPSRNPLATPGPLPEKLSADCMAGGANAILETVWDAHGGSALPKGPLFG